MGEKNKNEATQAPWALIQARAMLYSPLSSVTGVTDSLRSSVGMVLSVWLCKRHGW